MRVGSNPEKFNKELVSQVYHRIIIPVYIPHFEGYFEDAFEILKLNINSLLLTVHSKTRITIYNNYSAPIIKDFIDELYQNNELIDQVFHSKQNLGKVNAILAAVKGNLEPLITITDADVLFKHDWQMHVESIFKNFPKTGMVSPVPSSIAYNLFTSNNWYYGILGKEKIRFKQVKNVPEMKRFEESLGGEVKLYTPKHMEKYLVLSNKKASAVMGSGHFVATLRREVFDKGSSNPAYIKIQGGVENRFIDKPNEDLGFLRLSTLDNYAYHLGNTSESWMFEEFEKLNLRLANHPIEEFPLLQKNDSYKWKTVAGKIIKKILLRNPIKGVYFRSIGLKNGAKY